MLAWRDTRCDAPLLDVFGAYNSALWPAVLALRAVTAAVTAHWLVTSRRGGRVAWPLLAVHWAWSGVVYHWLFFRSAAAIGLSAAFVPGIRADLALIVAGASLVFPLCWPKTSQ